ncbi:MAG: alpha/beta hydrolase [Terracidiphilus sp.]|jgi:acetyl esterase/lipase
MCEIKKPRAICNASIAVLLLLVLTAFAAPGAFAQSAAPAPAAPDPALPHGQIQFLWPEGAPGAVGTEEQDKPHLEVFSGYGPMPRPAVIVCPGGGYRSLAYDKEGTQIAEWLNLRGITAFVLTYRLTPRYHYPEPLLDGYRSVRWVRSHAAEYHIAPDRIGMWGFSAGGHLVAMVGTHFDDGNPEASDPIDRVSDRPDFVISSYGAVSLQTGIAKPGALSNFFGKPPSPEELNDVSPDLHVTPRTPPFFLYATTPDQSVPVLTAVVFYTALVKAGVPAEMHIFETGPHGTALGRSNPELAEWPTLLENWLRINGWIPYPAVPAMPAPTAPQAH